MPTSPTILELLKTATILIERARRKRYQVHAYVAAHPEFPVNTYMTNSRETLATCLTGLLANPEAGLSRVEIRDTTLMPPLLVMAPVDLDHPTPAKT